MTTRRSFLRLAGETATLAFISGQPVAAEDNQSPLKTRDAKRATPLLDLQQRFVDLRFGMFVHFNMATFQDREWGDPTGPTSLFDPTHLDTDQWAEAAVSAGMTYACITPKHHD